MVKRKKPNRLWLGLEWLLGSLPNTVMTLWGLRLVMTGYLLAERWYRTLFKEAPAINRGFFVLAAPT